MDNHEDILDALTAYGKNSATSPSAEIPPILEQYLNGVAKNGETLFPWPQLKPLVVGKMEQVLCELRQGLSSENIPPRPNVENVRFDVMHARIMDAMHKFNGAPFTIQRLCELLTDPRRHYKRSDKFMRGLEKNVLVVSTVDPFGRKVVGETSNKPLVNGLDTNGVFPMRESSLSVPLPPVPGWVNTPVSMATRAQNAPAGDSSPLQAKQSTIDGSPSTNGVSAGLSSTVYSDQGEALAVHAEEVVEEMVVTMDTTEVGSVATDGGEAMAEEEEEELEAEDKETSSSSSSSSSSSEELSTSSDTGEAPVRVPTFGMAVSSSVDLADSETRPWAVIANEGENRLADSTDSQNGLTSTSAISANGLSTSPTCSGGGAAAAEAKKSPVTPQKSLHDSDKAVSTAREERDSENLSCSTVTTSEVEESESEGREDSSSFHGDPRQSEESLVAMTTSSEGAAALSESLHETPKIRTYAQVVASSSSSSSFASMENISLDSTEVCDSVAGLERLVGSVQPSPTSSAIQSSLLLSSSPSSSLKGRLDCEEASEAEPVAKRCRLSDEQDHTSTLDTICTSPISSLSSSSSPSSTSTPPSQPSESVTSPEAQTSSETVVRADSSVDTTDRDFATPSPEVNAADELAGGDCFSEKESFEPEATNSSPPLSSSTDSTGFEPQGEDTGAKSTSVETEQVASSGDVVKVESESSGDAVAAEVEEPVAEEAKETLKEESVDQD